MQGPQSGYPAPKSLSGPNTLEPPAPGDVPLPAAVTGVILVGGCSSRMGMNKALLSCGGERLLDRVVARVREAFPRVLLVGNQAEAYGYPGLPVVRDIFPGRGPLSGIHAALSAAGTPYIFVVACDMPFVDPALALHLARQAPGHDVVVVRDGDKYEPLFAVYARECLPVIESLLYREKRPRVVDFFSAVRVKYIDQQDITAIADPRLVFFNVNTPGDWTEALKLINGAVKK
nr:molybdenum cofactor guanylyltransferase [Desulfofundulus thermobenzoicus]